MLLAILFFGLLVFAAITSAISLLEVVASYFIDQLGWSRRKAAWTLGASRLRTFIRVVAPQSRRGLLTAVVLGFAHTVGEFGVVLMVGGNIPGQTQVVSIAIYEHVEALDYGAAHGLSLGLLLFSFLVLLMVYSLNRRWHTGLRA